MSGKAIGTSLSFGFPGCVTRNPDTIISSFANVGDDPIQFGEPVVFDAAKNGVRKIKGTDTTNAGLIGIAVRRIGQPYEDSENGWYYKVGDIVDVLVRGSIAVELAATTSAAARGKVYVYNGSKAGTLTTHKPGLLVCVNDSTNNDTIELPNTVLTTGKHDSGNIAEVTILTRAI